MQSVGILAAIALFAVPTFGAQAATKAGDEYEIIWRYETSEQSSDGSSGSSRGSNTLLERVIAVSEAGLELEYDHPHYAEADDRARDWQLPARVFRPAGGQAQLLNAPELEARLEDWLKAAQWPRDMCGRWIFTWNAFLIDCDPKSVLKTIEAVDLRSADLRAGAAYHDPQGAGPGTLAKVETADGLRFAAVVPIDPEAVRRERAEADVAVGELTGSPVTLEAALRERANEQVSGTVSVSFDTDPAGTPRRRTRVTEVETRHPDGQTERRTATEVVERRLVSTSSRRGEP